MSSLKKNFVYQIFYQVLISVLPFVTSPYISRVLGAENIGIYSYTFSIIVYFRIFCALGIKNYGNRAIAKAKDNQESLNKAFSSIFAVHAIVSILVIIIYIFYLNMFGIEYKLIAFVQILYLVSELLDINWFYFGLEKFKLTVTRNMIVKILTIVSVFIFVNQKTDLLKYTIIMAVGSLISTSTVWMFLRKYARFVKISVRDMVPHIKPMFVLFFAVIATSLYSYMGKIMLGSLCSMEELGYYENAGKMIEFPTGFILALGTVMLPKVSNLVYKGNNKAVDHYIYTSMRFSMIAAMGISFGIAGISREFPVVFWGSEFSQSGTIMMGLAITIIIMSWNGVIRNQYLIPKEFDKLYMIAVIAGAVVNFILNYLLIPQFGAFGAVVGTIGAYLCILIVQTAYVAKELSIYKYFVQSIPYALIGFIMFLSVRYVGGLMGYTVMTLVVEVLVGVIVFVSLSIIYAIIFKDTFVIEKIKQAKYIILKRFKIKAK